MANDPLKLETVVITDAAALGRAVRARRLSSGLTQAQAAGVLGVGVRFLSELERGKPTLSLELVLRVVQRLGLELILVPRGASPRATTARSTQTADVGLASISERAARPRDEQSDER